MEATTVFCISCGKQVLVFPLGSLTEIRPVTCPRCREKEEERERNNANPSN